MTLQLVFDVNRITKTIALVLAYTERAKYRRDYDGQTPIPDSMKKAGASHSLFKDLLNIDDVRVYTNLAKAQLREKMDMLYEEVQAFDRKKKQFDNLLVLIAAIGAGFNAETASEYDIIELSGESNWEHPQTTPSKDGSKCYAKILLDTQGRPTYLSELVCRLCTSSSTFAF